MKKAYLTILTIVTIFCVIIGSLIHLGPFINSRSSVKIPIPSFGKSKAVTLEKSISGVDCAVIDIECVDLTIDTHDGDDIFISYDGQEDLCPVIEVESSTLNLTQNKIRKIKTSKKGSKLTVSLPKDKKMEIIEVDGDMANINVSQINAQSVTLDADMANVSCINSDTEVLTVNTDMGNVTLDELSFKNLSVDTDMGSVSVKSSKSLDDYSFDCSADMAAVTINGKTTSGDYSKAGTAGSVDVDTSMGHVVINY